MAGGFPCILEEANALGISGHVGPRSAHRRRNRCGAGPPYHSPLLPLPPSPLHWRAEAPYDSGVHLVLHLGQAVGFGCLKLGLLEELLQHFRKLK